MHVEEFAAWYATSHDIEDGYAYQLMSSARGLVRSRGSLQLEDVTAAEINHHLKQLKAAGRSDSYRKSRRHHLMVLAREARRRGYSPGFVADDVMRIRVRDRTTRGWTAAEVRQLVASARRLQGEHPTGIRRTTWWESYIRARWDSGLDDPSTRSIEGRWIRREGGTGRLSVSRGKSGKCKSVVLRASTMLAIDACLAEGAGERRLVWPLGFSIEMMRREARTIIDAAGLAGSLKWLRSGSGSSVEARHPGQGHQHLANTRAVFERHYEMCEVTRAQVPLPEPL